MTQAETLLDRDHLAARYALVRQVAMDAAQRGMAYYRKREQLDVEHKDSVPQDVVSIADRELEVFIKERLAEQFPDDGFVGEEGGAADLQARCVWVVDPIDGTSCFVNGLHTWCVSIGLLVDGQPWLGAVADANHNELFHACRGLGAYVNDTPIRVSAAADIRYGVTGVGTSHRRGSEHFIPFLSGLLNGGGMFIRNGSGALMIAYVAAGRLVGYYETHINSWDCAAGLVLVSEAGGRCSDFLRGDGLLGGNPLLVASPQVYPQLAGLIGPSLEA
ncbi:MULTISPECIES: inositol monophosphatase family protein [unclassified Pseudomonas]|uniref:inositol monophosphatase family protein n=1 Tax=unclassified Pseudomonas TaxID=196821 RepID=UPI001CFA96FE|nr:MULTISPECIES: inositol monophosphatase [unclassified Pseudomonas]WLH81029.1 inositol monophosphatase [Pseudomonas sp. FP2335]